MPTNRTTQRSLRRYLAKKVFGGSRALVTRGLPARVVTAALAAAAFVGRRSGVFRIFLAHQVVHLSAR